jgi:hypothetical protein
MFIGKARHGNIGCILLGLEILRAMLRILLYSVAQGIKLIVIIVFKQGVWLVGGQFYYQCSQGYI